LACAAGRAGIANKPQPAMNTTQAANLECMGVSFADAKFICVPAGGLNLGSSSRLASPTTRWIMPLASRNVHGEKLKPPELI
jgi:hypothetical protein